MKHFDGPILKFVFDFSVHECFQDVDFSSQFEMGGNFKFLKISKTGKPFPAQL